MKDKVAKAVLAVLLSTAVMGAWILFDRRNVGHPIFSLYLMFTAIAAWVASWMCLGTRWKRTLVIVFFPWAVTEALLFGLELAGILRPVWVDSSPLLVIGFIVWGVTWGGMDSPRIQRISIRHGAVTSLTFRVIPTIYLVSCVLAVVCVTDQRHLRDVFLLGPILTVLHLIHALSFFVLFILAPVWVVLVLQLPCYPCREVKEEREGGADLDSVQDEQPRQEDPDGRQCHACHP